MRVVRSPETGEGGGGLRPPLVRTHRERLERGEALDRTVTAADREAVERLIEAAERPWASEPEADYVVTVTEVLGWLRNPAETWVQYRIGHREASPAEAAGEGREGGGDDEAIGRSRIAAAAGRAAHRFLEWFDPARAGDGLQARAVRFLEEEGLESGADAAATRIVHAAERFHSGEIGVALAAGREYVRREAPFLMRLPWGEGGGTLLRGTMDLVFRSGDGDWVVDYKTGRVPESDTTQHDQLRLYALALREIRGSLPTRALLWSLPEARAIEVSLAPADLEATWGRLERAIRGLARGPAA